jgi:hypothetical protein
MADFAVELQCLVQGRDEARGRDMASVIVRLLEEQRPILKMAWRSISVAIRACLRVKEKG